MTQWSCPVATLREKLAQLGLSSAQLPSECLTPWAAVDAGQAVSGTHLGHYIIYQTRFPGRTSGPTVQLQVWSWSQQNDELRYEYDRHGSFVDFRLEIIMPDGAPLDVTSVQFFRVYVEPDPGSYVQDAVRWAEPFYISDAERLYLRTKARTTETC